MDVASLCDLPRPAPSFEPGAFLFFLGKMITVLYDHREQRKKGAPLLKEFKQFYHLAHAVWLHSVLSPQDSSCAKVVIQLRSSCFKITKSEVNFELLLNAVRSFKCRADASLRGTEHSSHLHGPSDARRGFIPVFSCQYLFLSAGSSVPPRPGGGPGSRCPLSAGIAPLPSRLLPAAPSPPAPYC